MIAISSFTTDKFMHSPASSTQTRADMAFNSSDILQDLNLTCLSSSSSSSSAQSLQLAPLHTCSSTEPTSNKRTTAMMKILTAEDALVAALREALDAGTPLETLQAHISKSIAQQLIRHDQPATPSPPSSPSSSSSSSRQRSTSSPEILLPIFQPEGPREMPGFERQKKSKRVQSYGLR